jgi:hypothetical protein
MRSARAGRMLNSELDSRPGTFPDLAPSLSTVTKHVNRLDPYAYDLVTETQG